MSRYRADELPEYNEAVMCPMCEEQSDVLTEMYGIIGGGAGPYTMCSICGLIITKSFDEDKKSDVIDSTGVEIKGITDAADSQDHTDDKGKTTDGVG
jgi:hypothetical protein